MERRGEMSKFDKFFILPILIALTAIPIIWIALVIAILYGPKKAREWLNENGVKC